MNISAHERGLPGFNRLTLSKVVEGAPHVLLVVSVSPWRHLIEPANFEERRGLLLPLLQVLPIESLIEPGAIGILNGLEGRVGPAGFLVRGKKGEIP